jgi:hypothetical protein
MGCEVKVKRSSAEAVHLAVPVTAESTEQHELRKGSITMRDTKPKVFTHPSYNTRDPWPSDLTFSDNDSFDFMFDQSIDTLSDRSIQSKSIGPSTDGHPDIDTFDIDQFVDKDFITLFDKY